MKDVTLTTQEDVRRVADALLDYYVEYAPMGYDKESCSRRYEMGILLEASTFLRREARTIWDEDWLDGKVRA